MSTEKNLDSISKHYNQVIIASGSQGKINAGVVAYQWFDKEITFRDPYGVYGVKESRSRNPMEVAKGKRQVVAENLDEESQESTLIHSGDIVATAILNNARRVPLIKPVETNPILETDEHEREKFALDSEKLFQNESLGILWQAGIELYGRSPELPIDMQLPLRLHADFGVLPDSLIAEKLRRPETIRDSTRIGGVELAEQLGIPIFVNSTHAPHKYDQIISYPDAKDIIIGNVIQGDRLQRVLDQIINQGRSKKLILDFGRLRV